MNTRHRNILSLAILGLVTFAVRPSLLQAASSNSFGLQDLVSDVPGRADHLDANLVNPWGIAYTPTSPLWIADNGTGVSTIYNGEGVGVPLVVTVPPPAAVAPPSAPTGIVFNGTSGFEVEPGRPARFLFATEDGTISGWNPAASATQGILKIDNSGLGTNYKGLAIGNNGSGDFLYGADFHGGKIDAFDSGFAPVSLPGSFVDPTIPSGYAPFNIQNIGGELYVTYALQDATGEEEIAGPGKGFVDVFDLNGVLVRRLASQGALDAPWGLALAPSDFGPFGGALLVGNSGDGLINAYDLSTGNYIDALRDLSGNPIEIDGLRGLAFGNGGNGGDTGDLYFTAGIDHQEHGLFGKIGHVPEPGGGATLLTIGLLSLLAYQRGRA